MDERGASETMGTILMIALTVVGAAGLAALVAEIPKPAREKNVDLTVGIEKGAGAWGSGDEVVRVDHRGGDVLTDAETAIVVRIGATTTRYGAGGVALGGPFTDGRFVIGESWTKTFTITDNAAVDVDVLLTGRETDQLAATSTLETPCATDVASPTVQTWTQAPADVDAATSGAVQVTVALADDCAGVDAAVVPTLEYRVFNTLDWQTPIAMTALGGNQWRASIPDPTWANYGLKTLEYRVLNVADTKGNVGTTETRSDVVNPLPTYFQTFVADVGTVTDFAFTQSASDAGAEGVFDEVATGSSPVASDRYGTSQTSSGATNPGNAIGSPNDNYGTLPGNNNWLRVGGFSAATGTITKVELGFEGYYTGAHSDDNVKLSYRVLAATGATSLTFAPAAADTAQYQEVTADRSWTWQDVADTEVQAEFVKTGSEDAMDVLIDALWLRVTYTETRYNMSIQGKFTGVPGGGASYELQLKYKVATDTFRVQVWDGTAWNTRGSDLTSPTSATWAYTLTAGEYQGGSPKMRFIDVTPTGATQGHLYVDYGRVRAS